MVCMCHWAPWHDYLHLTFLTLDIIFRESTCTWRTSLHSSSSCENCSFIIFSPASLRSVASTSSSPSSLSSSFSLDWIEMGTNLSFINIWFPLKIMLIFFLYTSSPGHTKCLPDDRGGNKWSVHFRDFHTTHLNNNKHFIISRLPCERQHQKARWRDCY